MKILVASDSYKGCLSSKDVASAVCNALTESCQDCECLSLSVADGGEGTVRSMVDALHGRLEYALVHDPLGREITAEFGVAGNLAIIESAAACGLTLLRPEERNPLKTSTSGLAELILAAVEQGCTEFIVGLGGSATNDGGMGMVRYPGFLERTRGLKFTVACDVDTPFVGDAGASRVFAPQKGASPEDVEILEQRLQEVADIIEKETQTDVRDMPGAGAAGGLGGAFKAYLGAELKRGVDMVLDLIGFDSSLEAVDLVITGEGCSDFQTVKGKTAYGILCRAKARGIPVALLSGSVRDGDILREAGFSYISAVTPETMPLEEAMKPEIARYNISSATKALVNAFIG